MALSVEVIDDDANSEDTTLMEDKTQVIEEDTFEYIKLDEAPLKQLTRGQKKMLSDTIEEIEKEDMQRCGQPFARSPDLRRGLDVYFLADVEWH